MKNKGFTLVELLAVITLMALLSLAAFELLDSVNRGNKKKSEEVQVKNILSSAIAYVPTSDVRLPERTINDPNYLTGGYDVYTVENGQPNKILSSKKPIEKVCLSLDYLHSEGIIEDNIESPMTGKPYENALVCILLVNSSTKDSLESKLEEEDLMWTYDGVYLYYFDTSNRANSSLF